MAQQIKPENPKCAYCETKTEKDILVSVKNDDKWEVMLCKKKVKEKLLNLGYVPTNVNEVYTRFIENFSSYPICPHKDDELKPY